MPVSTWQVDTGLADGLLGTVVAGVEKWAYFGYSFYVYGPIV